MDQTVLAPSTAYTGHLQQSQGDFARQTHIQPPPPCAQDPSAQRVFPTYTNDTGHDRTYTGYGSYKPSSFSSDGSDSLFTPMSSFDLEKSSTDKHSRSSDRKPGRVMYKVQRESPPQRQRSMELRGDDRTSVAYSEPDEEGDDGRRLQEQKAAKILVFFSGPCVMLSALNTIWAIISVIITTCTQPVRLCANRPTFRQQLSGLLGPALNLQLKCIYTPLPPHANDDRSYHPWMLAMIHITSPFLSLGMLFMSWVLAVYWISSLVVGDPAGLDKRDDGRETVLSLRGWWERYLMSCVMDE
ncbi:hypothetical protein LTR62_004455 [Meristemomyces frigidus]|uniref:Uncharacterized protein n=1 Tax=Meristemomyces frigidus TaxID=1508187 RepID=A0AAN7TM11_9PEZI|nr:hypothetical protein LTR62_004455 [Meristemomyces frigidus]